MLYTGESIRNHHSICSRHFTSDSYLNLTDYKLHINAVATLFGFQASSMQEELKKMEKPALPIAEHVSRDKKKFPSYNSVGVYPPLGEMNIAARLPPKCAGDGDRTSTN